MSARRGRSQSAIDAGDTGEGNGPALASVNEARLRGRLAVVPEPRDLPSGDVVSTFRLVVDRPVGRGVRVSSVRVDTIDCAAYRADVQRRIARWQPGDVVEVVGSLRRRFFQTGGGAASRYEVEVLTATRVVRAASTARATMGQ